jgi:hypothetical protein
VKRDSAPPPADAEAAGLLRRRPRLAPSVVTFDAKQMIQAKAKVWRSGEQRRSDSQSQGSTRPGHARHG